MRIYQICFVFILIHFSTISNCQNLELEILNFNKSLKKEVLDSIRSSKRLRSGFSSHFEVITLPYCYVDPASTVSKQFLERVVPDFKIEPSMGFILIKDTQRKNLRTAYKNGFISFSFENDISSDEMKYIKMIELANKHSKSLFFVKFSEKSPQYLLGFLKGDSTFFINKELQVITDFKEIVIGENGSFQKWLENMEVRLIKSQAIKKISDLEGIKQVLRQDYLIYHAAFPSDTVKVLNLLLDEINQSSQMTNNQRFLLKEQITIKIKKGLLFPVNQSGIWFYGLDIAPCIVDILTRNQYINFSQQRELNSWLASQASNKFYFYLINTMKIPEDNISDEFRKLIFN